MGGWWVDGAVGAPCDLSIPTCVRLQEDTKNTRKERTKPSGKGGRTNRANEETKKRETKKEATQEQGIQETRRNNARTKRKHEKRRTLEKEKKRKGEQHERRTYEKTNN